MRKIILSFFIMLTFLATAYSNNHFGNNLEGCGLTFKPINLEKTSTWKQKNITNKQQAKLKPAKNKISFNTSDRDYTISPLDQTLAQSLPKIGKWMMVNTKSYDDDSLPDDIAAAWVYWRGKKDFFINGVAQPERYTVEPINSIFVLSGFDTEKEANNYLISFVESLGYSNSDSANHSGGYGVYFDDKIYSQLSGTPSKTDLKNIPLTFNKDIGEYTDHFRIMGPYVSQKGGAKSFVYAMSISRESQWFKGKEVNCGNLYISFNQARNTFINNVINSNAGVNVYLANLNNYITSDASKNTSSTGDHVKEGGFVSVFTIADATH
ncbi:hypothetical protein LO80_07345 [Candidatus Francisella endociliophora]|uniref:Uncharacterized protein n=1 Tax=Candidatus Francisella endociliophora TaxID=653937 RepID=A0A097ERW2_9GAMM|nr:hypothetical protein [Francisella sp. FSC1006]AIT10318.1 hypothetical protein LO80_07345 [Francisella sp. FSC1006]